MLRIKFRLQGGILRAVLGFLRGYENQYQWLTYTGTGFLEAIWVFLGCFFRGDRGVWAKKLGTKR